MPGVDHHDRLPLTAATRLTSSSWRPGSASVGPVEALALGQLGRPDHHDRGVSAAAAAASRLGQQRVVVGGGRHAQPDRQRARPRRRPAGTPAAAGAGARPPARGRAAARPGLVIASTGSAGTGVAASMTATPVRGQRQRGRPPAALDRCRPVTRRAGTPRQHYPARLAPADRRPGRRPTRRGWPTRGARRRAPSPSAPGTPAGRPGSPGDRVGERAQRRARAATARSGTRPRSLPRPGRPARRAAPSAGRRHLGRHHPGAAAALDRRVQGVRADHGDAARPAGSSGSASPRCAAARTTRPRPCAAARLDQPGAGLGRRRAGEPPSRSPDAPGSHPRPGGQRADPAGQPEQPDDLVVEQFLGSPSRRRPPARAARPTARPARHRQVERRRARSRGAAGRVPVRDDYAVEAPLVLEHVPQQPPVLGHPARR